MKVYIIDDSMMTWAWAAEIASHIKELEIVGFTDKPDEVINNFNKLEPDFVILNYNLFQEDFIDIVRNIKLIKPDTTIAMLSNNTLPEFKNKYRSLGIDYFFIQTRDYYQKIYEILLNIALSDRLQREWYNITINN